MRYRERLSSYAHAQLEGLRVIQFIKHAGRYSFFYFNPGFLLSARKFLCLNVAWLALSMHVQILHY